MKYSKKKDRGVSLIEMVAVIVVLALAIPPLLSMWADVAWRSVRSEALADATSSVQGLMEEIRSKKFIDPEDPNNPALGPNGAEVYPNFDDVDDFNGYADTPVAGYSRCVTVDYAVLSDTTWTGNCSPANPATCTPAECHANEATAFKRIIVRVGRPDNLVGDVTLVAIVSTF